jgi:hypothetical protein
MKVSRQLEWTVLKDLCSKLDNLTTHPENTLAVIVSPDYSSTVGMHVAHHLSKDGEMLDLAYIDVPYPDEEKQPFIDKFLKSDAIQSYKKYHHVLLIEAGVITGGNYTWITNILKENSIEYVTVTLFQNIHSKYNCDIVGRYYDHNLHELEFYWEKYNKHWE